MKGEPDRFAAIERILDDLDACNYFYRDPARIPTARLELTKARDRETMARGREATYQDFERRIDVLVQKEIEEREAKWCDRERVYRELLKYVTLKRDKEKERGLHPPTCKCQVCCLLAEVAKMGG